MTKRRNKTLKKKRRKSQTRNNRKRKTLGKRKTRNNRKRKTLGKRKRKKRRSKRTRRRKKRKMIGGSDHMVIVNDDAPNSPQYNPVPIYRLTIVTLTSDEISVYYNDESTVEELKHTIHAVAGFPVRQQRLFYKGSELLDNQTIKNLAFFKNENAMVNLLITRAQ